MEEKKREEGSLSVKQITIANLRSVLGSVVEEVARTKRPVIITIGQPRIPVAAIVSYEWIRDLATEEDPASNESEYSAFP
jgi:hypothetical protein